MGLIKNLFGLAILIGIGSVLYPILFGPDLQLPKVEEKWFGKTLKLGTDIPKDPVAINKFSMNVSEAVLQDLKKRLESARFVEPIDGTQFNYGFNSDYLRKVVDYWKTKFNWRKQELILNKFNHYKTQINGIDIHFIHVKPAKPAKTVIPLMVIHGWPGSVWEYYKSIPLLIEPVNDIVFEVICPSLPGYGFSEPPQQEGLDATQTARIFLKLMERLNHKKFFVHGGDWGSIVSRAMAILYPENIRAMHITDTVVASANFRGIAGLKFFTGMLFPSLVFEQPEKDYKKLYPFMKKLFDSLKESVYAHIQATKPDTIGAALIDSPVGLAAYILEKFSTWTDKTNLNKSDGGLTLKFTLDELLTNVMIYWTSDNLASSLRFYKETIPRMFESQLPNIPVLVPTGIADFPNELTRTVATLAKHTHPNLVQFTEMPTGGHFAAFEEPKLVSDDIRKFAEKVLEVENIVKNK